MVALEQRKCKGVPVKQFNQNGAGTQKAADEKTFPHNFTCQKKMELSIQF